MAGDLRSRLDRDAIGEGEEISESRGRELLDDGEIAASAAGSGSVESITSLGGSEATSGDDDNRGTEDGSTCWCETGDSVALIAERDGEEPGSEDRCCWRSCFG